MGVDGFLTSFCWENHHQQWRFNNHRPLDFPSWPPWMTQIRCFFPKECSKPCRSKQDAIHNNDNITLVCIIIMMINEKDIYIYSYIYM